MTYFDIVSGCAAKHNDTVNIRLVPCEGSDAFLNTIRAGYTA